MPAMIAPTTAMGATTGLSGVASKAAPFVDDAALLAMDRRGKAVKRAVPSAAPASAPAKPRTSPVDTGIGAAERATNYMSMAPFLAMPLGMVGKGVGWVGNKTGLGSLKKAGSAMGAPAIYLEKDVEKTFLAKPVASVSGFMANGTASVVGGVSRATGLDGLMQRRGQAGMEKQLAKAQTHLASVPMHEAPSAIRGHVRQMHEIVHTKAPTASQMGRLETLLGKVEGHLAEAKDVPKTFSKPFGKATKSMGKGLSHHSSAVHWTDVEKGIRDIPGKLQKTNAGHVLMSGGFAAGSTVSMAADARSFTKDIAALKGMYKDLTGKNISTVGLLTGKVPPMIADARSKLVKTLVIKEGADAVSLGISLKELFNPRFAGTAKSMIGFMGAGLVGGQAEGIVGGNNIAAYEAMKSGFDPKQPMPAEYYAQFLGELSPDLKKRGGATSPFTQAVAQEYAAQHATPQQVLKEIDSGALVKRVEAAIERQKTVQAKQPATPAKERPVVGKHTQKIVKNESVSQAQQPAGHAVT